MPTRIHTPINICWISDRVGAGGPPGLDGKPRPRGRDRELRVRWDLHPRPYTAYRRPVPTNSTRCGLDTLGAG